MRQWLARPVRPLLCSLAIAAAVALIIFCGAAFESLRYSFQVTVGQMLGVAQIHVAAAQRGTEDRLPQSLVEQLQKRPEIELVSGRMQAHAALTKGDEHLWFDAVGVDPGLDEELRPKVYNSGHGLTGPADQVVIDAAIANLLHAQVGDTLDYTADGLTSRKVTVVGIVLSIFAAYFASLFYNAMDIIQLVFGFVNAPLFATFLLGMFWKRTTGTGAFLGLFGGIAGSTIFHALTTTTSNLDDAGHVINTMKGGYLGAYIHFPSEMAQNFWLASFAFTVCFVLTLVISLATARTKTDAELKGLVYSLTPKIVDNDIPVWQKPAVVGIVLLIVGALLAVIFW